MKNKWFLLICFSIVYVKGFDKHQFHFSAGNVAYGDVPRKIHINGFWYIHPDNKNFKELFRLNYTAAELMGNLFVCKTGVEAKLLKANSHLAKQEYVERMNNLLRGKSEGLGSIQPYIDVRDCTKLDLSDVVYLQGDKSLIPKMYIKEFHVHHTFEKPGPILFVDSWGVAAYHYRPKHTDAQRITHCENDDAQFPVIFNKRPICPRPALKSTVVDSGKLTVFKPNIESVQKKAYRCYVEHTYIETYQTAFGANRDNMPLGKAVKAIDDSELCRKWIREGQCDLGNLKFTNLAYFNKTFAFKTDTRMATRNPIRMRYVYSYVMQYTIANCIVDIGYIRTTPPFKNMLTPWGYIPNDYLYASNYSQAGGEMIVWEKFKKDDICRYVPISSMDAKRITYNSKDFLEQDPHANATAMYHFLSDAEKSVYTSDNTQIVEMGQFNCVSDEANRTLYAINNDMLVAFEEGASIYDDSDDIANIEKGQTTYHPHYAYNELTVIENGEGKNEVHANPVGGDANVGGECEIGGCKKYTYTRHSISDDKSSDATFTSSHKKRKPPVEKNVNNSTPLFATVQYLRHKLEEYQNEEVVRRAQAWCENQQHLYDIQLMIARLSPSAVISSYLNRPVSANSIGNGVFITHYCQVIKEYMVAESLFVNNTAIAPYMDEKTFAELYKEVGVPVEKNLCFTMPIITFKDSNGQYRLGQLNHDQSVSTISHPWVEECKFGRIYVHVIGSEVYVFSNYERLSVTSLDKLFDHSTRLRDNVMHLDGLSKGNTTTRNEIEPLLESTQFIDIYTKYDPKLIDTIVTGFKDTEIYGYREKLRMISSFEDLIAHVNKARLDNRRLDMATQGYVHSQYSNSFGGFVGDGFKILVDGIGEGAGFVIESVGGVVENTIGKAIDETGNILGGVADFAKGPIMDFIIIVAAISVVAFLFYLFIRKRLMKQGSSETVSMYHATMQQPPPYTPNVHVRKRNLQNEEYVDF